jgi:hypothetical protein
VKVTPEFVDGKEEKLTPPNSGHYREVLCLSNWRNIIGGYDL